MLPKGPSTRESVLLAGGIWGPGLFFLGWIVGGLLYPGYSFVVEHISTLAAVGAPSYAVMTAGQLALATGLAAVAAPARAILGVGAAYALGLAAISVAVIILTPDGSGPDREFIHGGFAILLYASLVSVGILAGRQYLQREFRTAGIVALTVGVATAVFLWLSLGDTAPGLFQRAGITTTSVWLMAVALRRGPVPTG